MEVTRLVSLKIKKPFTNAKGLLIGKQIYKPNSVLN